MREYCSRTVDGSHWGYPRILDGANDGRFGPCGVQLPAFCYTLPPLGPDFLIIGAPKSGTTWLWRNLRAHPGLWMPPVKELHYFDDKAVTGWPPLCALSKKRLMRMPRSWWRYRKQFSRRLREQRKRPSLEALRWDAAYFLMPPSDRWYVSLFSPGNSRGALSGEVTPNYCGLDPTAIRHVMKVAPEARIVFFLRNPIEASYSFAEMFFDRIQGRPLHSVPESELAEHFLSSEYAPLFRYTQALSNWRDVYPEERIFVGFLEDIRFAPGRLLRNLARFLGSSAKEFRPRQARKVHSGNLSEASLNELRRLASLHCGQIAELDRRFGGYCSFWLWCADRLLADDLEKAGSTVPYPLGESFLWEEWAKGHLYRGLAVNDKTAPLCSGPLSEITPCKD